VWPKNGRTNLWACAGIHVKAMFTGGTENLNGQENGLADPARLRPFDSDDKHLLRVVIETPKGSRNKFALNQELHSFE